MGDDVRRQFNLRLSEEEAARLEVVAQYYGLTVPAAMRMLIKREFDSIERKKKT
jgi:hypothetical protein